MDTLRFILVLALTLVTIMLYEAWQQDYGATTAGSRNGDGIMQDEDLGIPQVKPDDTAVPAVSPGEEPQTADTSVITVETDVLRVKIDQGGTLISAELPDYPVSLDQKTSLLSSWTTPPTCTMSYRAASSAKLRPPTGTRFHQAARPTP